MPTPAKPFVVLSNEGRSHRTKEELNQRKQAEESLLTGVALRMRSEVKDNPVARREFNRINVLLKKIQKNDAIYEGIINRYCLLYAECLDFEIKRESYYRDLEELTDAREELIGRDEMTLNEYFKTKQAMQNAIIALDRQVQTKRRMLLDIEKENIMTVAAALRSVPKKVEEPKDKNGDLFG